MSSTTLVSESTNVHGHGRLSLLVYYVYNELLRLFRMPMFSVPTLLFPILFFAMFGLPFAKDLQEGINNGQFMMASFGTYTVMSVAMSSFSASIAVERGSGWNRFLKTTPMNAWTYFSAKISMAVVFELLTLIAFFCFAALVGHVHLALAMWLKLTGLMLIGTLPFISLGFLIGHISGPTSATIIANLIFFPMSFASGLFMPLAMLPTFIQHAAKYLPSYNLAQLGWSLLGAHATTSTWVNLALTAAYTIVFLTLGFLVYRRDQGRNFN